MSLSHFHLKLISLAAAAWTLPAWGQDTPAVDTNPDDSPTREFTHIEPQDSKPTVRAITPIDDNHVLFLNKRGQIGVAKFSPGLSLIGWDYYSEVYLDTLPSIAAGPGFSALVASPTELTQAFDTNQDLDLDFFQALLRDWPGRDQGVIITAGPVADQYGRVLVALSPIAATEGEPAKATVIAWHPAAKEPVTVTESILPITAMALSADGRLAARLSMPDYKEGYYISLSDLPPFDAENPDAAPGSIPMTNPSLLIPSELTKAADPTQIAFFREDGIEKLLAVCPGTKGIVEIVPEAVNGGWQGAMLLREISPEPIETLVEMSPNLLIGGGDSGFVPIGKNEEVFRISRVTPAADGLVINFTKPIDRFAAVKPENYTVTEVSLQGGLSTTTATPVIESDGRTVILKLDDFKSETVLRVVCQNVPSESGETLLNPQVFYKVHKP